MKINTASLRRCIKALDVTLGMMREQGEVDETIRDIYRAACIKEFELALEQSGKLLRKRLAAFFANSRQADSLAFKDLFRHANKHGLIDAESAERWFRYRDSRNVTAHDYGEPLAEDTLKLLPMFLADAKALADMIEATGDG